NDAFIGNNDGHIVLEDGSMIRSNSNAFDVQFFPGAEFDLGTGASIRIENNPSSTQRIVGTASKPIVFQGGELRFRGSKADLAHVSFTNTTLTVDDGADVTIYGAPGQPVVLGRGFNVERGSRFKAQIGGAPPPLAPRVTADDRVAEVESISPASATPLEPSSRVPAQLSLAEPHDDRPDADLAEDQDLPGTLTLEAYPNPFNPTTTIRFSLPEKSEVSLIVYDMMGREVTRLVESNLSAGTHEATFEAGDLASGMYVYRLVAGTYAESKTMLLLK
ncbi:MAG: T9SS type A sorting domain-containing protein, partial [Bacteroidota bacterium]